MLYKLSPLQKHQEQIWPCHKNGHGQPRVIIWKHIAAGQGQTTPGDKILMSTETACHFGHLLQVSKKSLGSLILYNFFMILYMYIALGQGLKSPWGRNFDVSTNMLSLRSFVVSYSCFEMFWNKIETSSGKGKKLLKLWVGLQFLKSSCSLYYKALHVWSCPALCLCVSSVLLAFWSPCLGKRELVFVLIVHLFVSYAHIICVTFSLPPGVRGWLRLLLVALPGLFCLPFWSDDLTLPDTEWPYYAFHLNWTNIKSRILWHFFQIDMDLSNLWPFKGQNWTIHTDWCMCTLYCWCTICWHNFTV